jgi:predicted 3-demethylubiquinone-9 3-methyltransferase (glyoxalase superfamily)
MPTITPNLWCDMNGLELAEFYVSIFPNSKITAVTNYTSAGPGPEGSAVVVDFELDGQPYTAINGGPEFTPNAAISLLINCDGQQEVDYYWDKLTAGGGEEIQCGWLKDKFGFHWQVWPVQAHELVTSSDPEVATRATQAMFTMKKIDIDLMRDVAYGKESVPAS